MGAKIGSLHTLFLSTPSARRATPAVPPLAIDDGQFLSTPSARRATFSFGANWAFYELISIHALREEGDHGTAP